MRLFVTIMILVSSIAFLSMGMNISPIQKQSSTDTLQSQRNKYINEIKEQIKGKEKMAVDSVFINLKVFSGFPAENLLIAMNSWSRALGVGCNHCHTPGDWELDDKPEKDIARQMSAMTEKINGELLSGITGLKAGRHIINCTSCHNGNLKPALRMNN